MEAERPYRVKVVLSPSDKLLVAREAARRKTTIEALVAGWIGDQVSLLKIFEEMSEELQKMDFDVDLLGFSSGELQGLSNADWFEPLAVPDDIPDPPDEPATKPGDL